MKYSRKKTGMVHSMGNRKSAGHLAALFTIIIWGTTFISTKVLLADFKPVEILFFRFVMGFAALLLVCPHRMKGVNRTQEMAFVLAGLCGMLSVVFCGAIRLTEHQLQRRIPNPWLRAFTGGCVVILLTWLCGTTDYNGAGMAVIAAAVEEGSVRPAAFVLKILFTAVTLGAGF